MVGWSFVIARKPFTFSCPLNGIRKNKRNAPVSAKQSTLNANSFVNYMKKFFAQNIKPLMLIVLMTAVGALFGHAMVGFLLGVIIITFVTLLL